MPLQFPKNDDKYSWTNHVGRKMMFYGLSADRVKRVVRNPYRSEKGVAPNTIAVMQPGRTIGAVANKPASWKEEVWVMYAEKKTRPQEKQNFIGKKKVIITAWPYPEKALRGKPFPIPADILEELKSIKY